jgi:hypothetical protein
MRIRTSALLLGLTIAFAVSGVGVSRAAVNCAAPVKGTNLWYMSGDQPLAANKTGASTITRTCLIQFQTQTLTAGQGLLFYARMQGGARTGTTKNIDQIANIYCDSDAGTQNSQNNVGAVLAQVNRYYFTAPATGTYTCTLEAFTLSSDGSGQVVAAGGSSTETYVSYTSAHVGREWLSSAPALVSSSSKTAYYINSGNYAINPGVTSIQVYAGVLVTDCYSVSDAGFTCNSTANSNNAQVSTQLVALLTNSSGTECTTVAQQKATTQTLTIVYATHHQKIHNGFMTVTVPSSRPSGCNFYKFKVLATWLSGNPVILEASTYSNGVAYDG